MSVDAAIREAVETVFDEKLAPYLHKLAQPEPRVYTVAQVSTILCIDRKTVKAMIDRGDLPMVPITGRVLIPRVAIDDLVAPKARLG